VEPPATKESFHVQKQMKITWHFLSSTACTKPSLTTVSHSADHHARLCVLNEWLTHLHTIESLMACSPYTYKFDNECQLVSRFSWTS
jgi:hypothetical protein